VHCIIGAVEQTFSTENVDQIPHRCLLKIQATYDALKTAERKAVDHLLKIPDLVSNLTIVEFASQAGCSEATVVRLSKRLGYEGFPELKVDFARAHNQDDTETENYQGITRSDDPMTIFRKVFHSTIGALEDTVKIMKSEGYLKAVDAIVEAGTIMFCGLGDGAVVASEAHQRFMRTGKRSVFSSDPDLQLMYAAQLSPGDVFVGISHTGRSRTVLDALKVARESGAVIISLTNYPYSPLAKRSDIVLLTAVFTSYLTVEVMSKRVTELCILESLSINYLNRVGKPALDSLRLSNIVVEVNKV
jgi:RpiR family transcriptional regulator, carbohydrate utilization regulator